MRRVFISMMLTVLFVGGCFHANVDRDAIRVFSGPSVDEPPPDASQRERNLYNECVRLDRRLQEKEDKIDRLEDEIDDLKDTIKRQEKEIKDLRKALGRRS